MRKLAVSVTLAVGIAAMLLAGCEPSVPRVSAMILVQRINAHQAPLIVDVRSADEFRAGHVPGAINIPHDQLAVRHSELGATDREILLYCESGRRAGKAEAQLVKAGFSRLQRLDGDMKGWRAQRLPLEY